MKIFLVLSSFILVYIFMAKLGPAYPGSSVGGPEGASQPSMSSRHSSMLGGAKEADMSGYRGHPSAGAHYGGQYSSVYSSAGLSSGQQVSGFYLCLIFHNDKKK